MTPNTNPASKIGSTKAIIAGINNCLPAKAFVKDMHGANEYRVTNKGKKVAISQMTIR